MIPVALSCAVVGVIMLILAFLGHDHPQRRHMARALGRFAIWLLAFTYAVSVLVAVRGVFHV